MSEVEEELEILPAKQALKLLPNLNSEEFIALANLKRAILAESEELDIDKIAAIKKEIASGEYKISSTAIARKLLEREVEEV